jgi:NAD(P)-dependent dehydrogenase (short-subunit alcohol dehydrogenase family)
VVFSSSGSGGFGKFEESNYASGKMSVIGLKNVLKPAGQRKGVRVNALVPGVITLMT